MIRILFFLLLIFTMSFSFAQENDGIFTRIQAISNNGIDFYNIDGIEITSQKIDADFTSKNISRHFKQLKIREKDLISSDSLLGIRNYYILKSHEEPKGMQNNIAYYFVETADQKLIGFTFSSINKSDKELEHKIIKLVRDNQIPESVFNTLRIDSIDFAGRKFQLGGGCNWMGINNVKCPYFGQMNWSVHKELDDARITVSNHFELIKARKNGKVIADTTVNVIFEGTETSAKKVVYDFTGVTSALVGMSGGKTLTIYFVATPVRQNNVSCVMSFWNNDQINQSGLPPLLEKVMKLE